MWLPWQKNWLRAGLIMIRWSACIELIRLACEVYPRSIQQPLPCIRVPLAGNDPDVALDIRAALEQAYDAGSYDQRIDYSKPCQPPLSPEMQAWADQLVSASKQNTGWLMPGRVERNMAMSKDMAMCDSQSLNPGDPGQDSYSEFHATHGARIFQEANNVSG
ncbi:MAG: DUF4058 family protein [Burkholderiaceae bacterium]